MTWGDGSIVVKVVRFEVYFPKTASGLWDVRERTQAGLQDLYIWKGGGALD